MLSFPRLTFLTRPLKAVRPGVHVCTAERKSQDAEDLVSVTKELLSTQLPTNPCLGSMAQEM